MPKEKIIALIVVIISIGLLVLLRKKVYKKGKKTLESKIIDFDVKYPITWKLIFAGASIFLGAVLTFGYLKDGPISLIILIFALPIWTMFLHSLFWKVTIKKDCLQVRTLFSGKRNIEYQNIRVSDRGTGLRLYTKGKVVCEANIYQDYYENLEKVLNEKCQVKIYLEKKYCTKEEWEEYKKFIKS